MKQRQIVLMYDRNVTKEILQYVIYGIADVLKFAGVDRPVLTDWGNWHKGQGPKSFDYHVESSRRPKAVDASRLINSLGSDIVLGCLNPVSHEPVHKIVVLSNELWAETGRITYGMATEDSTAVVSLGSLTSIPADIAGQFLRTLTSHEYGHVLGLVPKTRTRNVEQKFGLHCTNRCTMRQESGLTDDTLLRVLFGKPFCPECEEYLRSLKLR